MKPLSWEQNRGAAASQRKKVCGLLEEHLHYQRCNIALLGRCVALLRRCSTSTQSEYINSARVWLSAN